MQHKVTHQSTGQTNRPGLLSNMVTSKKLGRAAAIKHIKDNVAFSCMRDSAMQSNFFQAGSLVARVTCWDAEKDIWKTFIYENTTTTPG